MSEINYEMVENLPITSQTFVILLSLLVGAIIFYLGSDE